MLINYKTFAYEAADDAHAVLGDKAVLAKLEPRVKVWISWDVITLSGVVRFCRFNYAGVMYYAVIAKCKLGYIFCLLRDGKLVDGTLHIETYAKVLKDFHETLQAYIGAPEFAPIECDALTAADIKKHAY